MNQCNVTRWSTFFFFCNYSKEKFPKIYKSKSMCPYYLNVSLLQRNTHERVDKIILKPYCDLVLTSFTLNNNIPTIRSINNKNLISERWSSKYR